MPITYLPLGGLTLEVTYTYDPGKPASGPYAPEYPTLEVEEAAVLLGNISDLLDELGALPAFKKILISHLEKEGSLR